MKVTDTLEFPEMQEILEEAHSIDDVWSALIAWFSEDPNNLEKIACANKLIEFNNMRNSDLVIKLDQDVSEIKGVLRGISRKYGHTITVTRRQKALIGVIAKMVILIQRGEEQGMNVFSSLEGLKDFIGIRIVAQTGKKDTPESQQMAYEIMNQVLKFLVVEKKNTLSTVIQDKTVRKLDGILVPEKSGVWDVFKDNVKDYFYYVKPNGYQCLHAVPMGPDQQTVEIQVRTQEAEVRAEYADATSHDAHKQLRYEGFDIPVDLSKVDIEGVTVVDFDGMVTLPGVTIYDRVGLVSSVDPLNLLR